MTILLHNLRILGNHTQLENFSEISPLVTEYYYTKLPLFM